MSQDFEKMLASVISRQKERKVFRDPWKSKLCDHRKRGKVRFGKEKKAVRKAFYRAFRAKNNQLCRELVTQNNPDDFVEPEPVFKKTGGWLTW